jgi:hypothetical protein
MQCQNNTYFILSNTFRNSFLHVMTGNYFDIVCQVINVDKLYIFMKPLLLRRTSNVDNGKCYYNYSIFYYILHQIIS